MHNINPRLILICDVKHNLNSVFLSSIIAEAHFEPTIWPDS